MREDRLERFCWETYKLYYKLYPWASLSPTVHKMLRHGCEIARKFKMPMLYYAEDCLESGHKFLRRNMTAHARQISREARLLGVYNRTVYVTDCKIAILTNEASKSSKKHPITPEMEPFIRRDEPHA